MFNGCQPNYVRKEEVIIVNREKRVRKLLTDYYEVYERQFIYGDYGAVDELIDLTYAIGKAELTDRQREALRLVYVEQLTQAEAAEKVQCSQPAVNYRVEGAIKKIALYV